MVGIVLVSHSYLQAKGLQKMARQASQNLVNVSAAGGVDAETLGTNAEQIHQAIQEVYSPDGVLILFDLGSALMSTQMAIEMLAPEQRNRVILSNAPMVEGTIAAAIEASLGHTLAEVNLAAEAARDMKKVC